MSRQLISLEVENSKSKESRQLRFPRTAKDKRVGKDVFIEKLQSENQF